jgi:hypothetical protein
VRREIERDEDHDDDGRGGGGGRNSSKMGREVGGTIIIVVKCTCNLFCIQGCLVKGQICIRMYGGTILLVHPPIKKMIWTASGGLDRKSSKMKVIVKALMLERKLPCKKDLIMVSHIANNNNSSTVHVFCASLTAHLFFLFPSIAGYTKGTHAGYEWGFMQGFLSALECIRKTKPAYLPNPSSSTTTEKLSTQLSSLPPQQTLETICATIHASSNYNSSSVSTTTYTTPPSSSSNSRNENLKGLIDQVKVDTMDFLQNTLNIAITRHTSIS